MSRKDSFNIADGAALRIVMDSENPSNYRPYGQPTTSGFWRNKMQRIPNRVWAAFLNKRISEERLACGGFDA